MKEKYLLTVLHIQILITVFLFGCFPALNLLLKLEVSEKRALRFVLNGYESP